MLEVISLNFKTADVRKDREGVPDNIEVAVTIDSITKESEEELTVEWSYGVEYKPDIGMVKISGDALCRDTPANIDKVIDSYEKKKEFPADLGTDVLNMINANASINAIFIIRPFNLFPPFTPPLLEEGEEPKK